MQALSSELFGLAAFICETLVFAWLGLGLFGIEQRYDIVLAVVGLVCVCAFFCVRVNSRFSLFLSMPATGLSRGACRRSVLLLCVLVSSCSF